MAPRGIQDTELGRSAGTVAVIVMMEREGNGVASPAPMYELSNL